MVGIYCIKGVSVLVGFYFCIDISYIIIILG